MEFIERKIAVGMHLEHTITTLFASTRKGEYEIYPLTKRMHVTFKRPTYNYTKVISGESVKELVAMAKILDTLK